MKIYMYKKIRFSLVTFMKNDVCEAGKAACTQIYYFKASLTFVVLSFVSLSVPFVCQESHVVMKTDCASCRVVK